MASSVTAAAMARNVARKQSTLMVDEFDQKLAGDTNLLAPIMETLNGGYTKSGVRLISVQVKGGWEDTELPIFSPKVIAGVSNLPSTLDSRCLQIFMQRLKPGEELADWDEWEVEPRAAKLKKRLEEWGKQHVKELELARPESPSTINSRQREVTRPLFAVADSIGGDWPDKVRNAITTLFIKRAEMPSENIKFELLIDIEKAFGKEDQIFSRELVEELNNMEDRPWGTWAKGKAMNQNQLARQLKDFRVYPREIRLGMLTAKGYLKSEFLPHWERYTHPPKAGHFDSTTDTPAQSNNHAGCVGSQTETTDQNVAHKMPTQVAPILSCFGVSDQTETPFQSPVEKAVESEEKAKEMGTDDEDPFSSGHTIIPAHESEQTAKVREYRKDNIDWSDPFLRGLKPEDLK
jgi:hypothetical protein